ncbi:MULTISPECIES: aspartoacylase [Prochlorococcus]|uniref:aspartoacylase n=1 Tax=Prochlorococcus TaxID=1218 RepID=UPI00055B46E4|nr:MULTISPECIES: aspartoacylase [Prochlorococcus]
MPGINVLLVAGTHGNEINAPWLFDQWKSYPELIKPYGLNLSKVIGNPLARETCKRYIDQDLNRSFTKQNFSISHKDNYEIKRAKELVDIYGSEGRLSSQIVIDFHSTTSCMGCSLVVYGRRSVDLALASLIQSRIGIPIYLHEGDESQAGFLVEYWPCGLVVEIGPVPQGTLNHKIIHQTLISLQVCIEEIAKVKSRNARFPKNLIIHRHLKSIDFPRDSNGKQCAYIHSRLDCKDWCLVKKGTPLFQSLNGNTVHFDDPDLPDSIIPVFINEAAYAEKGIAMSFTIKEIWDVKEEWKNDFYKLLFD